LNRIRLLPVFLLALWILGPVPLGCAGPDDSGLRGQIIIDGSSTVYPVTEAVSEEFQLRHPRVMVTVGRSGTGGGLDRFCRGETDIADASRSISHVESARCEATGVDYLELPVALDGLSVLVNPANSFVDCLTVDELRRIWRPGSLVRTWRDVRPEFPGAEIRLYGPGTDSGTFDTFTQAIVGQVGSSRTDFHASEDDNVLVQGITGDRYALGYLGYAYLAGNQDRLKVVDVNDGHGCVGPSEETIRNGSYSPLGRTLFLYVNKASLERRGVRAFLEYFMTNAEDLIPPTGSIPLNDELYRANLEVIRDPEGVDSLLSAQWSDGAAGHE